MFINNAIGDLSKIWDDSPKYVDLEDSRTILHAYNDWLAPTDMRLYAPVPPSAIPTMLRFVAALMEPGSEDLLPLVFGLSVDRLWNGLFEKGPRSHAVVVEIISAVFHYFRQVFCGLLYLLIGGDI
jgi:hypothetical protein